MCSQPNDNPKPRIMIVDDDDLARESLVELFSDRYKVVEASSGPEAIDQVRQHDDLAVIVLDIKMAGMDGIEAHHKIKAIRPDVAVIFHTAFPGEYDERQIDQTAMPRGYVVKGNSLAQLEREVRNAAEYYVLKTESGYLDCILRSKIGMVVASEESRRVMRRAMRVARTRTPVLILGETGTGKEEVAKAIHALSPRSERAMSILHCNHKHPELVEAELFGYKKGAFTGATEDRLGKVEYADGGTLFLDEIGDLDLTTQAKLLRVTDNGTFHRLGDPAPRSVDIRLVSATNRSLSEMVDEGSFRGDLLARINTVTLNVPPLRERREEIPELARFFISKLCNGEGLAPRHLDDSAMKVLVDHDWPQNVRQLAHVIEGVMVNTDDTLITADHIAEHPDFGGRELTKRASTYREQMDDHERQIFIGALTESGGVVSEAARRLGVDPSFLHKKLKKHGIDALSFRA